MFMAGRPRQDAALRAAAADTARTWEPSLPQILALLAAFAITWTLYFTITEAPVSIKHDMAEAYAWGRQFQLGYNQHPPFWAWICGLWFSVLPRTGWAFSLLSSLNAGIGLWGAWAAIGDFASGRKRIAAWLLLLLTPLYTFYAYKYDANIIFISIWPWTLHYFTRSVRSRRLKDAILFGVCIGCAMMSKYYAVILVATCFLAALQHPERRRYFTSFAPYVSGLVSATILAPHVWWLATHNAPPVHYLEWVSDRGWAHVLDHAAKAFVDAVGMNLGPIGIVAAVAWHARRKGIAAGPGMREPERRILTTLVLAPVVLTVASALAIRTTLKSEMMVGIFPLLPLLAIELAGSRDIDRLYRISGWLAGVLSIGALLLSPAMALRRAYHLEHVRYVEPFQEIAAAATKFWHQRTSLPLLYVAGTDWYENETAFYSPDRPHVFKHFDYDMNLWVTPQDLKKHGLLSICVDNDKKCLSATARFATPQSMRTKITVSRRFLGFVDKPATFVVTAIPPRGPDVPIPSRAAARAADPWG